MADQPRTAAGIPVAAVYTEQDVSSHGDAGLPGEPPYTRGIHPEMYRRSGWTLRPLAGFGTPEDTNGRLRRLLAEGATGLNVVFDYPTNRGYDSDDPLAEGDAGQGGVAIDSVEDMTALFQGIPLDEVSVSVVLSHPVAAGAVLAMYVAAAEARGIPADRLRGTLQNDFMMETFVLTAPTILEPAFSFRLSMDVIEHCTRHLPQWNPISYTGYNYREAGCDAAQEAAFVIGQAELTLAEMARRGLDLDAVARRLSSFFGAGSDFFEEIAKYRAARRLYHRRLSERFTFADARSTRLRFHVQTAGSSLTAQQPLNNITRAGYQALAAVLGGAQSLHVSAYDEALCVPSETAAITALRTQQILAAETGVTRTADPLGGSYYVEWLTDQLEARVELLLTEIEAQGGLVRAVESGWVHRIVLDTAYRRQVAISSGELEVVGVNTHMGEVPTQVELFRVPEAVAPQARKLASLRARRDSSDVSRSLGRLREVAAGSQNTFPALLDAVRAGATLGECCQVFRDLRGGWQQPLA